MGIYINTNEVSAFYFPSGVESATVADGTATISFSTVPSFSNAETPSGAIDGQNVTFTLLNAPNPVLGLNVFVNGVWQTQGVDDDYTLEGNIVTMAAAPPVGCKFRVSYRY